jgi:predicted SnoaL-like aldol condensation-catalyzing enzyme
MSANRGDKKLARAFVDDILVNGRMEKLASYFDGDTYTQHNPQMADGVSGPFRVEKDKIAEHWDTIEAIPPRSQWKNANGRF